MSWTLKENIPPRPASITDIIDGDLDEVKNLDLTDRGLEILPDDIGRLGNLASLYVGGNSLTGLPPGLAGIAGLRTVFLGRNAVKTFPPALIKLLSLGTLDLSRNPLESIPAEIGHLSALTQLWLDNTALAELPVSLAELPLVSLGLPVWTDNSRTILRRLEKLRVLNFSDMDAAAIDEALALTGPALANVTLMGNGLTALPNSLTGRDLTALRLYRQKLAAFPSVRHLRHLQDLTLANCGLQEIPPWIGTLSQLRELSLFRNAIRTLPRELADLGDGLKLDLDGNPLEPPLDALAKEGTPALFAYLRGLPPSGPMDAADDPAAAAQELPEQRPAPVEARVEGGRLVRLAEGATAESQRQEFAAMHHEVRRRAEKVLSKFSNHYDLLDPIRDYLECLGETPEALQPIALGFAGQDLDIIGGGYRDEDGTDRLLPPQRALWNALVARHALLIAKVPEWRDYAVAPADAPAIPADAVAQATAIAVAVAQALRAQPALADSAIPDALDQVARRAQTAPPAMAPLAGKGMLDSDANLLSLLSREALKIAEKIPEKAREMTAEGVIGLGLFAGGFLLANSADILALANSLPRDFGWLRAVVGALKAHWPF